MLNGKNKKKNQEKNKKKLSYVNLTKLVSTDVCIAMAMIVEYRVS